MKRHLISLILTVVLVVGGVNVIPAGTKDVSAAMQLNDFEPYYNVNLATNGNIISQGAKSGHGWSENEDGIITDGNDVWWVGGADLSPELSVLRYKLKEYKDFSFSVAFKNQYKEGEIRYGAMIGFGTKVNADGSINGWNGEDTGVWMKPCMGNVIKLAGTFKDIKSGNKQANVQWTDDVEGLNIADEEWHTMKLEVKEGIMKIWVDGKQAWANQPLAVSDSYDGGYLFLASNNGGTQFRNIEIKECKSVLADFEPYYNVNLGQNGNIISQGAKSGHGWSENEDGIITDGNDVWWVGGADLSPELSVLRYKLKEYKDFSFSVDFKNHIRGDYKEDGVTKKDNWEMRYGAMIGFGTKVNADGSINGWNGEDTGVWIKPYGTNSIKLAGSFDDINSGTHQSATQYDTTIDGVDIANEDWHTMKLEVKAGIIKITVDGKQAWPTQPFGYSDWYKGGYLFLASNNGGTQFRNIQISEVKKPSVQIDGKKVEISDGKVTLGDAKYGYLCDGKMYAPKTTVKVVDGTTFTSVNELSVSMANGAGIRYKGNEEGTGGIRFQASIKSDNMAAVASSAITEGTLITAKDINDAFKEELTLTYSHDKINVKNSGWFNGEIGTYCGSICRVNELNYIRDFTARAYVTVNYENADAVTIYSSMGPERNISDIAKEVKRQEYPGIAEEYWSVIDSFIKK